MESKATLRTRQILAAGFGIFLHASVHAEIDWSEVSDVSEQDKQDITELVQEAGMYNAATASTRVIHPGGGRMLVISSPVGVSGLRHTWTEVSLCRLRPGIVDDVCTLMDSEGVGNWKVRMELTAEERWRVSDGDWFVDVQLGTGISYAEAEVIVLAIHRNELIRAPESGASDRRFDADNITSIRTVDPITRKFDVEIDNGGSGYDLAVTIRDGKVELYRLGIWIA